MTEELELEEVLELEEELDDELEELQLGLPWADVPDVGSWSSEG